MSHGLGRRHAPDPRDRNYPMAAAVPRTTRRYRYWNDLPLFLDQGSKPHCVGYSLSHWVNDGPTKHSKYLSADDADLIYKEAQFVDEWPGEGYAGTSVRAGAKILQSRGFIESYLWASSLDEVIRAILEVGPVVVGTDWYSSMFDPDPNGFLTLDGDVVGGHAYLLNGVSVSGRKFRLKNSWGRGWNPAHGGRAWICFEDFERLLHSNGEACLAIERKT